MTGMCANSDSLGIDWFVLGTIDQWQFGAQWPMWVWLVLLLACGLWIHQIYTRSHADVRVRRLWLLRFAAIVLVVFALADLSRRQFQVEKPELVIAVDISESSGLPNGESPDGLSRLDAIKQVLSDESEISAVRERYRLRYYRMGATPKELDSGDVGWIGDLVPEAEESRLGDSIHEIVESDRGRKPSAIVLFSDGAVTSGRSLAEAGFSAAQNGVPVFCVGTGSESHPPNIKIAGVQCNRRVRVDQPLNLRVDLASESLSGETCSVTVADVGSGDVLASEQVKFDSDSFHGTLEFQLRFDEEAIRSLSIQAEVNSREVIRDDNLLERQVQVFDGKIRVLIIQDYPGPWYRFLKGALYRAVDEESGERAFEVHTILQQASVEYETTDSTMLERFPSPDELDEYDLVVIGDARLDPVGSQRGLTKFELGLVASYVRNQAGNVVFVPGPMHWNDLPDWNELEEMLPRIDDGSTRSGAFVDTSPLVLSFSSASVSFQPARQLELDSARNEHVAGIHAFLSAKPNPSAMVLAWFSQVGAPESETQTGPAISLQTIGRGTVLTHFTDQLYRLRYRSDTDSFGNYWVNLVTDLAAQRLQKRDQLLLLRTRSDKYRRGETVEVIAEIFDPLAVSPDENEIAAMLTGESGESAGIVLTRVDASGDVPVFRARLPHLAEGRYQVAMSAPARASTFAETTFEILPETVELRVLTQQKDRLAELAENSGGQYYDWTNVDRVWDQLPQVPGRKIGVPHVSPVWNWWFVPALFALLLTAMLSVEWVLRRYWRIE